MNLSSEELISKRKELIKPVFDEFHEWLLEIKPKVPPTLMFGRAINYALSAWNHLLNYLDCPELYEYLRYIFDQAPFCESEKDMEHQNNGIQ